VRGYAPLPGQPPPIYPPGQFAAWNRRGEGLSGRPSQPDGEEGLSAGIAPAGSQLPQPARGGRGEQYYAEDPDPGTDPGYSVLATSDPAADVTSTQTWRAIGDGRSTGIWAAPPELREKIRAAAAADGASLPPAGLVAASGRLGAPLTSRPGPPGPGSPPVATDATTNTGSNPRVATGPQPRVATGPQSRVATGPQSRVATGPQPRVATGPQPRVATGPQPRVATGPQSRVATGPQSRVATGPQPRIGAGENPPAVADATRTDRTTGTAGRRAGGRLRRPHRPRPASVKLAITAALLLVVAAAATLVYTVVHDSSKPRLTSAPPSKPSATASPSASIGPYGDIASRQTDPQPLTVAQLYPVSFTTIGQPVSSVASSLSGNCAASIDGATLQSAVGAADCTQVARATYVDVPAGVMATIGVLNLSTGDAAASAAKSADANDFISQLTASTGPAQRIGQGTGIEEALAKGHYLILVWAELTNVQAPNTQQTTGIETFMTALVQNTVNKSLTTRLLTGVP
jgi:hypothetical protein